MHWFLATLTFTGAASAAIGTMAITIAPQRARIAALLNTTVW
jgi:hypothetical protein